MMPRLGRAILVWVHLVTAIGAAAVPGSVRAEQQGDCGRGGVTVAYDTPAELEMACRALSGIEAYFQSIGFELIPKVAMRFADRLDDRSSDGGAMHGYFQPARLRTVVYRTSDVRPWGLVWTPQLAASFLCHELAHMAIWESLGANSIRLRREWHEFLAYAIQLDLMAVPLRDKILAANSEVQPSDNFMDINEFAIRMSPEVFAVIAYKTYLAEGGRSFVGRLLRGEFIPPSFAYPFAALPGQMPDQ